MLTIPQCKPFKVGGSAFRLLGLGTLFLLAAATPRQSLGQIDPRQANLQGITQLGIVVNAFNTPAGVDALTLKSRVVASLKEMPFQIVNDQADPTNSTPVLRVTVAVSTGAQGLRSIFVETSLRELATLNRNTVLNAAVVDTWRTANPPGAIVDTLVASAVASNVDEQIRRFKAAFGNANGGMPDLARIANPQARWIRDSCVFHAVPTPTDSGKFVKAVADDFESIGISKLPFDDANGILNYLQTKSFDLPANPATGQWYKLTTVPTVNDLAGKGWLVVGGLKAFTPTEPGGQGLAAIIVANPTGSPNDSPLAYWGRASGSGGQNAPISQVFTPAQLRILTYYGQKLGN